MSAFILSQSEFSEHRGTPFGRITRDCQLPGVHCPTCGTWTSIGHIYPSVTVAEKNKYDINGVVAYSEFLRLKSALINQIGEEHTIVPGVEFGPLTGRLLKKWLGDLLWPKPWILLLTASAKLHFERVFGDLTIVRANIIGRRSQNLDLYEIEAVPQVRLKQHRIAPCETCGRSVHTAPKTIVLDQSSWRKDVSIQRIADLPTYLVVNKAFADSLRESGFRGATLDPVEIS